MFENKDTNVSFDCGTLDVGSVVDNINQLLQNNPTTIESIESDITECKLLIQPLKSYDHMLKNT